MRTVLYSVFIAITVLLLPYVPTISTFISFIAIITVAFSYAHISLLCGISGCDFLNSCILFSFFSSLILLATFFLLINPNIVFPLFVFLIFLEVTFYELYFRNCFSACRIVSARLVPFVLQYDNNSRFKSSSILTLMSQSFFLPIIGLAMCSPPI